MREPIERISGKLIASGFVVASFVCAVPFAWLYASRPDLPSDAQSIAQNALVIGACLALISLISSFPLALAMLRDPGEKWYVWGNTGALGGFLMGLFAGTAMAVWVTVIEHGPIGEALLFMLAILAGYGVVGALVGLLAGVFTRYFYRRSLA